MLGRFRDQLPREIFGGLPENTLGDSCVCAPSSVPLESDSCLFFSVPFGVSLVEVCNTRSFPFPSCPWGFSASISIAANGSSRVLLVSRQQLMAPIRMKENKTATILFARKIIEEPLKRLPHMGAGLKPENKRKGEKGTISRGRAYT